MKQLFLFTSVLSLFAAGSFAQTGNKATLADQLAVIQEVLQTSSYTYLHVKHDTALHDARHRFVEAWDRCVLHGFLSCYFGEISSNRAGSIALSDGAAASKSANMPVAAFSEIFWFAA